MTNKTAIIASTGTTKSKMTKSGLRQGHSFIHLLFNVIKKQIINNLCYSDDAVFIIVISLSDLAMPSIVFNHWFKMSSSKMSLNLSVQKTPYNHIFTSTLKIIGFFGFIILFSIWVTVKLFMENYFIRPNRSRKCRNIILQKISLKNEIYFIDIRSRENVTISHKALDVWARRGPYF